jgi:hypothetical protein
MDFLRSASFGEAGVDFVEMVAVERVAESRRSARARRPECSLAWPYFAEGGLARHLYESPLNRMEERLTPEWTIARPLVRLPLVGFTMCRCFIALKHYGVLRRR